MWKRLLTAMMMIALVAGLTIPAAAADTELSGEKVFEITKELYEQIGEIANNAAGDRITASVMFNGTVILQGHVSAAHIKDSVEKTANKIDGVKNVMNEIKSLEPAA